MTTITIRQFGDVVFFLDSTGFKKGNIKSTRVVSEKHKTLEIVYYVTCPDYHDIYMGMELTEGKMFDTYEAMLLHYAKVNPSN